MDSHGERLCYTWTQRDLNTILPEAPSNVGECKTCSLSVEPHFAHVNRKTNLQSINSSEKRVGCNKHRFCQLIFGTVFLELLVFLAVDP